MNESVARVISYIVSRWIIWGIVLVLLGILFAICFFIKSIRKYRWWLFIPLIVLTIYILIPTVQGLLDIKNNSFVTEYVEYSRYDKSNTRNSLTASQSIQITLNDGKVVILRGATDKFPFGEYTGTVTYAKRSKIIIDFVSDTDS